MGGVPNYYFLPGQGLSRWRGIFNVRTPVGLLRGTFCFLFCISVFRRCYAMVTFLDLSAAFDTLDHQILLKKTESITYGIHTKALQWFSSYLSDRRQSVTIGSTFSKPVPLQSGVPQGSVLGPILFTLYTQPLSNTIQKHQFFVFVFCLAQRVIDCLSHMCIYSKSKINTYALRLSVFCFQNRLVTEPVHDKGGRFAADLCIVFIYFAFQHQLLKEAGESWQALVEFAFVYKLLSLKYH